MSYRKPESEYVNNFMTKILVDPLSDIVRFLAQDDFLNGLKLLRAYIRVLPPDKNKDLVHYIDKIDSFFAKMQGVTGNQYAETAGKRLNYLMKEGGPLMREIYDTMVPILYDKNLFDWRSYSSFYDPSKGKESGSGYGRGGIPRN